MLQTRLILCPFPAHEDEVVEHHARADHRYVLQTLFQDDVDVAMACGSVANPPKIGPVGVDLVVCDQDETFGKVAFETAIRKLSKLTAHGGIARDSNDGGSEEIGASNEDEGKVLLADSLPCVKVVLVVKVQRSTEELGRVDAQSSDEEEDGEEGDAEILHRTAMLDWAGRVVFISQLVIVGSELDLGIHGRLGFGYRYRALANTLGIDARHVSGCDRTRCD